MPAPLSLHPLFSDHAVLPRDVSLPVFGRGVPGQLVKITLGKKTVTTRVDARGFWLGQFEAMPAGGPHVLAVSFASQQLIRRDIMIGDVWLAAGGSGFARAVTASGARDSLPVRPVGGRVRVFVMDDSKPSSPNDEGARAWLEPTIETADRISVAGFHFGTTLEGAMDCPIGVIQATCASEDAASWMPGRDSDGRGGAVFNRLIAPLTLFPVRGVIWWPDIESLAQAPLPGTDVVHLIHGWRKAWRRDRLPFLLVQAGAVVGTPRGGISSVREAQLAGVQLEATGLVVSADLSNDPRDAASVCKTIAERLVLCALGVAYGRSVPSSGPIYQSHAVAGGEVRIDFANNSGGLRSRGVHGLSDFEVADEHRQFAPARARVEGNSVIVSSDAVTRPVAVRYGWKDAPKLTLENSAGLPAPPFRTDDWPADQ